MRRLGHAVLPLVAAATVVSLGVPRRTEAQTCTAPVPNGSCAVTTSTTLPIGTVMQLTLDATATVLGTPGTADYDAGFVADNGPTATVKSNRPWRLQISAASALWSAANTEPGVSARVDKPAGDLRWSTAGGGPFTGLSTIPVDAQTGGASGGAAVTLFYRTVYDWTLDTPGAYSLPVVLTLTAP
ncbi:MAG: hypothetical protein ACREMJ_12775 [Gemmatimonadales bacterium]